VTTDLTFITNEPGKTLKERFGALIQHARFFDALVGYFFTSGSAAGNPRSAARWISFSSS